MSKIKNFIGRVRKEGLREMAWESVRTWLWPTLLPAMTAISAALEGLPVTYIILAAGAMFAFVTSGLLRLTEWRFASNPSNKITFANPYIGIVKSDTQIPSVEGFKLGFNLINNARFPIEVEIEQISTLVDTRCNPSPVIKRRIYDIGLGAGFFFYDDLINVKDMDLANKYLHASIDFLIKYGVKGKRKYSLHKKIAVNLSFDSNGMLGNYSWFEEGAE